MEQILVVDRLLKDISSICVAGDVNSLVVNFKLKRFADGVDKAAKRVRIAYENAVGDTGYDEVENLYVIDEEYFTFDWKVSGGAVSDAGTVKFAIEVSSENEYGEIDYVWQTCDAKLSVLDSVRVDDGNAQDVDRYYQVLFYENNDNSVVYAVTDDGNPIRIVGQEIMMGDIDQSAAVAVKGDVNSQVLDFTLPRYYKNVDLSEKTIGVKFKNAKGESDRSRVGNIVVEDETLRFSWLLDGNVTAESGFVQFAIEFFGYNENSEFYCWSTKDAQFEVLNTLSVDHDIENPGPTWLQKWMIDAEKIVKDAEKAAERSEKAYNDIKDMGNIGSGGGTGTGSGGGGGVIYTPSVSGNAVLSWTNNGGLANPTPVNIKGPIGETGPAGQDGKSITVANVSETNESGGSNVVTFSDNSTLSVKNGRDGKDGTSVAISNIEQSNAAGGTSKITFSDKKTLSIKNGTNGTNGKDGSSVSIKNITQSSADSGQNVVTFNDGQTLTIKNGSIGPAGPTGPAGSDGKSVSIKNISQKNGSGETSTVTFDDNKTLQIRNGVNGKDGVSVTHEWNGTILNVTSASGTTSANLKGDKGDKGDSIVVTNVYEDDSDGGTNLVEFSDGSWLQVRNGRRGEKGNQGDPGIGIPAIVKRIDRVEDTTIVVFEDVNGETEFEVYDGAPGRKGDTGPAGYTPQRGVDYYTEKDRLDMINEVSETLSESFDGKLDKLPLDIRKEVSIGNSGRIFIGKFKISTSQITVDIISTTDNTYNGKLVIAISENTVREARVYEDPSNAVTPNIFIKECSLSDPYVEVYYQPYAYSKNVIHIYGNGVSQVDNVCTTVSNIPNTAGYKPKNALTDVFAKKDSVSATGTVQSNWNENDPEAASYVKNRTHWVEDGEERAVATSKKVTANDGCIADTEILSIGKKYRVMYQDEVLYFVAKEYTTPSGESYIYCGNSIILSGNYDSTVWDDAFVIFNFGGKTHVKDVVVDAMSGIDASYSTTISVYEIEEIVHTIDEVFIPDTIARKSDVLASNGGGALSDWSIEIPSTPGYVKNRTHYDYTKYTKLYEGTKKANSSGLIKYSEFILESDAVYKVTINGAIYDSLVFYGGEIGSSDFVKYPFYMMYLGMGDVYLYLKEEYYGKDVSVVVEKKIGVGIKTLDDKYISDNIARKNDIPEIKAPNWLINDPNDGGYIQNRTHYGTIEYETIFDGVTKYSLYGTTAFYVYMSGISLELGTPYRVTLNDVVLSDIYTWKNNDGRVALGDTFGDGMKFSAYFAAPYVFIYFDTSFASENREIYLKIEKGTINCVKKLDDAYIPDTIARKSDLGNFGGISDWYVNDPEEKGFVKNRTHFIIPAGETEIFSVTDWYVSDENSITISDSEILKPSQTYRVEFDGVSYTCVSEEINLGDESGIAFGNVYFVDNAEPFVVVSVNGETALYTTKVALLGKRVSINIFRVEEVVKKLDEKFIPDTIARKSEVVPNWIAPQGFAGFIKHRTHYSFPVDYEEIVPYTVVNIVSTSGSGVVSRDVPLIPYENYIIICNDELYVCEAKPIFYGQVFIGSLPELDLLSDFPHLLIASRNNVIQFYPKGSTGKTFEISIFHITEEVVQKLDQKYYDQPCYDNTQKLAYKGVLSEFKTELPGFDPYNIEFKYVKFSAINRVEFGNTCKIICNGVVYENLEMHTMTDDTLYYGDITLIRGDYPAYKTDEPFCIIIDPQSKDVIVVFSNEYLSANPSIEFEMSLYANGEFKQLEEKFIPDLTSVTLKSPNGTRFKITVDDDGSLKSTLVTD